jgi:hypothetical protein
MYSGINTCFQTDTGAGADDVDDIISAGGAGADDTDDATDMVRMLVAVASLESNYWCRVLG